MAEGKFLTNQKQFPDLGGISALVSQRSLLGETRDSVAKRRLLSHTKARGKDSLRANVFKLILKLNLQATFRILQRVTLILIAA